MIRKPAVCGTFYPADANELRESIKDSFLSPFGVGNIPLDVRDFNGSDYPVNVMVPHAGFMYSGSVASHAYYEIAKHGIPDVFIILSPNHTGFGSEVSVCNEGKWRTPLGDVSVDNEFADAMISFSDIATVDFEAHIQEHSIEVQLPFLQFLSNNFEIVPVTITNQSISSSNDLAKAIVEAGNNVGKSYCIIASTDLSHFNTQERANKVDGFVLEDIEEMNEFKLFEEIVQYNITMCGYGPVMTNIIVSKMTGKENCNILSYLTSGDISGDFSKVVGYASAIFK